MDQIYIGHKKLYVNVLRYKRAELSKGLPREGKKSYSHEPAKNKMKEVWRKKKGKAIAKSNIRTHSYVDVVRRHSQEKWKGTTIETKHQVLSWIVNSMVGHVYVVRPKL